MKPECPIDWKTAFTAALLGFLGAYLIGGYLNMPDAGLLWPSPMWAGASSGI